jgi:hypothetical protein
MNEKAAEQTVNKINTAVLNYSKKCSWGLNLQLAGGTTVSLCTTEMLYSKGKKK